MEQFRPIIFIVIAAILTTNCGAETDVEEQKQMSVLFNKPVFQLKVHFFGVANIIEMNKISILKTYESDGQLTTELPLNPWMRPGENALRVAILPEEPGGPINPNAVLKLELWVESAEDGDEGHKIADIKFKGSQVEEGDSAQDSSPSGTFDSSKEFEPAPDGDVKVLDPEYEAIPQYEGAFYITRRLDIPSSLPLWAFFTSDDLPDYEAMLPDSSYFEARHDIFTVYKKVQDALAAGNIEEIIPMFAERSREIDQAFYYDPGKTEAKLRASMEDAANNPDMELVELRPDYVAIRREDNEKLVSLVREGDTRAIAFNFKSSSGSKGYPIMLRREDGEWIIIR